MLSNSTNSNPVTGILILIVWLLCFVNLILATLESVKYGHTWIYYILVFNSILGVVLGSIGWVILIKKQEQTS